MNRHVFLVRIGTYHLTNQRTGRLWPERKVGPSPEVVPGTSALGGEPDEPPSANARGPRTPERGYVGAVEHAAGAHRYLQRASRPVAGTSDGAADTRSPRAACASAWRAVARRLLMPAHSAQSSVNSAARARDWAPRVVTAAPLPKSAGNSERPCAQTRLAS